MSDDYLTEACAYCGESIHTAPGMDAYTEVTDYTTTEYTSEVYCNRDCLSRQLSTDTNHDGGGSA